MIIYLGLAILPFPNTSKHQPVFGMVSPTRKSFRFVSSVRACAPSGCRVESEPKSGHLPFPFSLLPGRVFPTLVYKVCKVCKVYSVYKVYKVLLPPPPKRPIQLQLALSVFKFCDVSYIANFLFHPKHRFSI